MTVHKQAGEQRIATTQTKREERKARSTSRRLLPGQDTYYGQAANNNY